MKERRASPRKSTPIIGMIIVSDNAPTIKCHVRNLSSDGACLLVSTNDVVPARFDLICDAVRFTCRVIWLNETEIGVMFV